MLFNNTEKTILIIWGCDRRDLTIQRLAFAAAYAVDPNFKRNVCRTRDWRLSEIRDEHYSLYFNTQAAEVLIFLQENNIDSYEKLDALANDASDRFHALSEEIRACETRLKEIGNMKKAITDYSKTRGVYEAYRKAGYSKKYFEEHRAEITIHKAAKKAFDSVPGKKIPRVKELSEEYARVLARKKDAYKEYHNVKENMKRYTIAQKNVALLLGRESVPERNTQPSRET